MRQNINQLEPNHISHPYQLNESIGVFFSILFKLWYSIMYAKSVLIRLIWFYTVFPFPIKKDVRLYGIEKNVF